MDNLESLKQPEGTPAEAVAEVAEEAEILVSDAAEEETIASDAVESDAEADETEPEPADEPIASIEEEAEVEAVIEATAKAETLSASDAVAEEAVAVAVTVEEDTAPAAEAEPEAAPASEAVTEEQSALRAEAELEATPASEPVTEEESAPSAEAELEAAPEADVVAEEEPAPSAEAEPETPVAAEGAMEQATSPAAEATDVEATPPTMAEYVDGFEFKPLKAGEIRDGVVVSVSPNEILVDVGAKSEGFIHNRELERLGKEYLEKLKVGDSVVVYVVRPEDKDGNIILSLNRAQQERDWREAERLLESGEVFKSTIIGHNRGGVICRLGKVRGFIPASQLVSKPEVTGERDDENRWAGLMSREVWLKVVELDRRRNRLILSERLAVRERRRHRKEELLSELRKGDVRTGRVSSIAKFGAFVDLGGADGLIHLSELSWARVNHPSEVLKVGEDVEVYVLNVDRDRRRIGLSLRRLEPEPWSVVHERYAVGQLVDGVITKLASFGAFARIEGTIEGLIHISELANHRVTHPKEVVKEGDELSLRIIRIDPGRRRMGLSLKRVEEDAYAELDWREAYGDEEEELEFDLEEETE